MQRTEELIREITHRRADNYERVIRELSESYEYVEVLETYWLINALLVEMPLAAVYGLARREDVLFVEPRYKELEDLLLEQPVESYYVVGVRPRPGTIFSPSADPDVVVINSDVVVITEKPRPGTIFSPSDIDPDKVGVRPRPRPGTIFSPSDIYPTVRYARQVINSDAFFSHVPEANSGWMMLVDSGVRATHQILSKPSVIGIRRDCVRGGMDCNTGPDLNPNDVRHHGTSCAAIICGNPNQGGKYRGVTRIRLDSWRVITELGNPEEPPGMLDGAATLRAFENAVKLRYLAISASIGDPGADDLSADSLAADKAFDAGVATIAAVGNTPGSNTAHAPANAHKAIGVGAFDVLSRKTWNPYANYGQSRGPTRDGRFKPDIQAPTNTITASGWDDSSRVMFAGTSGAAPYAASVAVLWRAFLGEGTHFVISPGHVYAHLILSTNVQLDGYGRVDIDNERGAGQLRMGIGLHWFGWVSIPNSGSSFDIPLEMGTGGFRVLDAALWWPESPSAGTEVHNDIDLYVVSPSGVRRAVSIQSASVFERARVEQVGPLEQGTWTLRIRGHHVPRGSQTVFWGANAGFG
jgi:serine protease AprX